MKVYFAHEESSFNTPQEDMDRGTVGQMGLDILDPNCPEIQTRIQEMRDFGSSEEEIKEWLMGRVDTCDGVVFRRRADGTIPAEVKDPVWRAQDTGKPVMEIPYLSDWQKPSV